ncbi:MAG: hypothetical protein IJ728_14885, partial [Selenomonadaceae bacterium]|nr:hypothetical protein [Selenomonadaceae bacterium]
IVESTEHSDSIISGGEDSINSGYGDDYIEVHGKNATILTGNGNDIVSVASGVDKVIIAKDAEQINFADGIENYSTESTVINDIEALIYTRNNNVRTGNFIEDDNFNGKNDGNVSYTINDVELFDDGEGRVAIDNPPKIEETQPTLTPSTKKSKLKTVKLSGQYTGEEVATINLDDVNTTEGYFKFNNGAGDFQSTTSTNMLGKVDSWSPEELYFSARGLSVVKVQRETSSGTTEITSYNDLEKGEKDILAGLYKWWLKESIKINEESYGLGYDTRNISVTYNGYTYNSTYSAPNSITVNFQNKDTTTLAAISRSSWSDIGRTASLQLNINMKYYNDISTDPINGQVTVEGAGYLDRTLAHEMHHAIMGVNVDYMSQLPMFIKEGMAELTHGIDDERIGAITTLLNNSINKSENPKSSLIYNFVNLNLINSNQVSNGNDEYPYAGGYLFLRWLANQTGTNPNPPSAIVKLSGENQAYYVTGENQIAAAAKSENSELVGYSKDHIYTARSNNAQTIDASGDNGNWKINGTTAADSIITGSGNDTINIKGNNTTITDNGGANYFKVADDSVKQVTFTNALSDNDTINFNGGVNTDATLSSTINDDGSIKISYNNFDLFFQSSNDLANVYLPTKSSNVELSLYGLLGISTINLGNFTRTFMANTLRRFNSTIYEDTIIEGSYYQEFTKIIGTTNQSNELTNTFVYEANDDNSLFQKINVNSSQNWTWKVKGTSGNDIINVITNGDNNNDNTITGGLGEDTIYVGTDLIGLTLADLGNDNDVLGFKKTVSKINADDSKKVLTVNYSDNKNVTITLTGDKTAEDIKNLVVDNNGTQTTLGNLLGYVDNPSWSINGNVATYGEITLTVSGFKSNITAENINEILTVNENQISFADGKSIVDLLNASGTAELNGATWNVTNVNAVTETTAANSTISDKVITLNGEIITSSSVTVTDSTVTYAEPSTETKSLLTLTLNEGSFGDNATATFSDDKLTINLGSNANISNQATLTLNDNLDDGVTISNVEIIKTDDDNKTYSISNTNSIFTITVKTLPTEGDDYIINYDANVSINALSGNDTIENFAEGVTLNGGAGKNTLIGSDYAEVFAHMGSLKGSDVITGFGTNDTFAFQWGKINSITKSGNDLTFDLGMSSAVFKDAANLEYLNFWFDQDNDSVTQFVGNRKFKLVYNKDAVDDTDHYVYSDRENVVLNGGDGSDYLLNIADNVTVNGGAGNDSMTNSFYGSNHATNIVLNGGDGNDTIENEALIGGNNVTINGGEGNDYITSSYSNISLNGGAGNDRIQFQGYDSRNATIEGGEGNDYIEMTDVNDVTINGGEGNDTIKVGDKRYTSPNVNVSVNGGSGNDSIVSVDKNVTIVGGTGDDTINASATYGDVFEYTNGDGKDIIQNYSSNDTIHIIEGTISDTIISNNDLIINIGTGSMTLLDAKYKLVTIQNSDGSISEIDGTPKWKIDGTTAAYSDLITITGLKNGVTVNDISLNNDVVTLNVNALGTSAVSISGDYKLALASNVSKPSTTAAAWSISGTTATYKSASTSAGYTLSSDSKSISYNSASGGNTIVTVTGLKSGAPASGISLNGNTVTLSASVLGSSTINISDGYNLALANDVTKGTSNSSGWIINGSTLYYNTVTSGGSGGTSGGGSSNGGGSSSGGGTSSGGGGTSSGGGGTSGGTSQDKPKWTINGTTA